MDPDSLNPDPDPAFQVYPDPGPFGSGSNPDLDPDTDLDPQQCVQEHLIAAGYLKCVLKWRQWQNFTEL